MVYPTRRVRRTSRGAALHRCIEWSPVSYSAKRLHGRELTRSAMSSKGAREARDDAEKDNLEDLSDEELDALLEEAYARQEEEEEEVPVPRSETAKQASKASKKKPMEAAADALGRSKQDSADGPPTGTALAMLAVSAVSAVVVFAMRAARRKQSPAPKRADTPAPTLAVDGTGSSTHENDVEPARRPGAAKKKTVPAAARRCANCGATQPKKNGSAPSSGSAAAKLLRCGGCRVTYYCSSECQRQHRPVHKKDCVPPAQKSAPATQSAAASTAAPAPRPAVVAATTAPATAAPDNAAAAAAAEGARRFQSLRARLGVATGAFRRGATGQAVSALQDIAMEAHELFNQHKLGRDIECEALRVAGHGMIRMGAWEPAEKCLDACLGVAQAGLQDDPPLLPGAAIGAFVALGTLASAREPPEFDLSQQWFAQALQVAREAGDIAAEASVCQSLANVAGKMGDSAAAAEAAEMALGLRRAKVEEARQKLVAAEDALGAFVAARGTESDAEGAGPSGGVAPAAGRAAPPITSPEHARAFGAAAAAKRALAESRRAEVAALANVGAALLKVEAEEGSASETSAPAPAPADPNEEAVRSAEERSGTSEDAPPSAATRVATGVARYEEALASLRRDAAGPEDLEMEIGLLLELANAHDNRVGGATGRARALEMRASLRDAVKALTGNQREFPNTCTLCSETMDPIEGSDEVSRPANPDAQVTCLQCLHGYHSACLLRWRERRLVEDIEQIEKAAAEGEDVSGRKPQKPRCPDCANIHARRAAAAEAAQRQQQSRATEFL